MKTFLEHNYKCLYPCTVLYLHQQLSVASVKKKKKKKKKKRDRFVSISKVVLNVILKNMDCSS